MEVLAMIREITRKDIARIQGGRNSDFSGAEKVVKPILADVKKQGDKALRKYTRKFDRVELRGIEVSGAEIRAALGKISKTELSALKTAKRNIERFAEGQLPKEWSRKMGNGVIAGEIVRPLDIVGIYVPGGKYPLASSVLMNALPAKVAGVSKIVMCTPPSRDAAGPLGGKSNVGAMVLAAAKIAGVDRVFKVGGAQAIAAMAYGTESIPKCDKIVGPGNIFVTAAKKIVFGQCGIDFLAGPSEVMVIAEKGNPKFIAADLLAQAEHDENASAILVTTSKKLAKEVKDEVGRQLKELGTAATARKSLKKYGGILVVKNLNEAFEVANGFAPEHLEIVGGNEGLLKKVRNAGGVFLGEYSAEVMGDYATGTNHVLPTGGFARARGGLSAADFVKVMAVQRLSKEGLKRLGRTVVALAESEGLEGHAKAVKVRMK